jgi:outer membrane biosynthesis protein TonB
LPQAVDPLADLDDVELDGAKKKGGGIGKFLLAAVVLAGVGGAFYLGQKSARQASLPPVVTVQAPPIVTVVATVPMAEVAAPSAEPSTAEPESEAPAAAEPEEAKAATQHAPRAESPSHESSPSQDDRNVELSREPSLADAPASPPKPAPAPVTKPEPEPDEPAATGPFDKSAAAAALARAASAAGSCRTSGDPSGVAQVSVTFSPTGRATRAIVNGPPFAGTATGGCIASRMTQAKVPPFTGSRVTVRKKVVIQ